MTLILGLTLTTALLGSPADALPRDRADFRPAQVQKASVAPPQDRFSVRLRCTALASGHVTDCVVLEETRPGYGFGEAALALMNDAQVTPITEQGRPVDAQFERTIDFTP
ncbi:Gram-negative bacterial tonB protein [Brevundimonas sp. SH203]|uniref:energy transducer TonB family protein n=1 Tax=Brevundimonas sp. SH203 TaxID=345167 RepID=UPI0009D032E7|nr:energy transducer TonB [Brevundimonas sp. SH203]GAW40269.1 Gram-negative bacterial tonB protein [Brevundimonas sp. SH203]